MRASKPQPLTYYWYRNATIGSTFSTQRPDVPGHYGDQQQQNRDADDRNPDQLR
jgi:hypothetical protein